MARRLAHLVADGFRRRGRIIQLRQTVALPGSAPLPNPPMLVGAVLAATAGAGITQIALNADAAIGRIVPGDVLTIGGQNLVATNTTSSRPPGQTPGFDGITVVPPLANAVVAGAVVTARWSADTDVRAMISSYPTRLVDGQMILARDLLVLMPAYNTPEPKAGLELVIDGDVRTIINADPVYAVSELVQWRVQAR